MTDRNEVDFSTFEDYRTLSPSQRDELRARARRCAHIARAECLKAALCLPRLGLQKLWVLSGRIWHRHRVRRRWQAEIGELHRLDERALRDIGMTRLDVYALARRRPGRTNK